MRRETEKDLPILGIVLWSSERFKQAIIWCEDQGHLAYLQSATDLVDPERWPLPGDLVELETRQAGDVRHASAVSLLIE